MTEKINSEQTAIIYEKLAAIDKSLKSIESGNLPDHLLALDLTFEMVIEHLDCILGLVETDGEAE